MSRTSPMTQADRAVRDQLEATASGDAIEAYRAHRALERLIPNGPTRYMMGLSALAANYPQAGSDVFALVLDSAPVFARSFPATWTWAAACAHLLGERERELAIAVRGRNAVPDSPGIGRAMLIAANAAVGRPDEVRKLAEEALNAGDLYRVFQASLELRAHGYGEVGDSLAHQLLTVLGGRGPDYLLLQRVDGLTMLNRLDEAVEFLEEAAARLAGPAIEGRRGVILALQGERDRAEQIIDRLGAATDPYAFGEPTLWRARIAANLGDRARAVDYLRQAFDQGFTVVGPALMGVVGHRDPAFQGLWDYEPFQEFVRPKG